MIIHDLDDLDRPSDGSPGDKNGESHVVFLRAQNSPIINWEYDGILTRVAMNRKWLQWLQAMWREKKTTNGHSSWYSISQTSWEKHANNATRQKPSAKWQYCLDRHLSFSMVWPLLNVRDSPSAAFPARKSSAWWILDHGRQKKKNSFLAGECRFCHW